MEHRQQMCFVRDLRNRFPVFFQGGEVLEIGSLNINGSFRELFTRSSYTGVDIRPGKDVDVVCRGHLYGPACSYTVVCSGECFEHDQYWSLTIWNMYRLLQAKGIFFTCATTGRKEHGTTRVKDNGNVDGIRPDYYRNLTEKDVRGICLIDDMFTEYEFLTNKWHHDLYFWGIKK